MKLTGDDLDNLDVLTYKGVKVGDLLIEDPERFADHLRSDSVYFVTHKTYGQEFGRPGKVEIVNVLCIRNGGNYYRHAIWEDEFMYFLVFSRVD